MREKGSEMGQGRDSRTGCSEQVTTRGDHPTGELESCHFVTSPISPHLTGPRQTLGSDASSSGKGRPQAEKKRGTGTGGGKVDWKNISWVKVNSGRLIAYRFDRPTKRQEACPCFAVRCL